MTDTPEDDTPELVEQANGTLVGRIDKTLYYQLEAQTADWQWILQAAIFKRGLADAKAAFVQVEGPFPMFFLAKSRVTPEDLATILGFKGEPKALAETEIIHLKPIGDQKNWQKPTVPYAGAA